MAEIRFTKNELRDQQVKLQQLERYLPTLQLKKAMLQAQANEVRHEIERLQEELHREKENEAHLHGLLADNFGLEASDLARTIAIQKSYENIAGVEIPTFEGVTFKPLAYSLFETPVWLDSTVALLRKVALIEVRVSVEKEKKEAIEKELREVSIRVNLFEKVMIPKAQENIKIIKVFLGDQQLAAVARAKVAKTKILERKARES